jgi:hypothetical protein
MKVASSCGINETTSQILPGEKAEQQKLDERKELSNNYPVISPSR